MHKVSTKWREKMHVFVLSCKFLTSSYIAIHKNMCMYFLHSLLTFTPPPPSPLHHNGKRSIVYPYICRHHLAACRLTVL